VYGRRCRLVRLGCCVLSCLGHWCGAPLTLITWHEASQAHAPGGVGSGSPWSGSVGGLGVQECGLVLQSNGTVQGLRFVLPLFQYQVAAMKRTLAIFASLFMLSGCFGYTAIGGHTERTRDSFPTYREASAAKTHPENGTVITESERRWCGLTIWAVIPVPLMLPVCKSYAEATFANNKLVSYREVSVNEHWYVCEPLRYVASSLFPTGKQGLCSY